MTMKVFKFKSIYLFVKLTLTVWFLHVNKLTLLANTVWTCKVFQIITIMSSMYEASAVESDVRTMTSMPEQEANALLWPAIVKIGLAVFAVLCFIV